MSAVASSVVADLCSGDVIEGRYHIIRKLADGGMGTVYLAEHVLIRRRVALKLLHADLATDSVMVRRFMNEASAAGTLGHPHIVESTDMGFTRRGVPYIVFEYLEGTLLVEEIYRLGGLPVRRALQIASQIASALDAAHHAKIAHLDLKSDNVFLIDRAGSVDHAKVLDFGISRFMDDGDRHQRGVLAGTPEFMAPEQVTMPDLVDGRADIYALGVLLYEMLTARTPHAHDDARVLLHRIVNEPPPPLDRAVPRVVEQLVFEGLLIKSREHRIQTMREVKERIDDALAQLGQLSQLTHLGQLAPARPPGPVGSPEQRRTTGQRGTTFGPGSLDAALFELEEPSKDIVVMYGEARDEACHDAHDEPPPLAPAQALPPASGYEAPRAWWLLAAMLAGIAGGAMWLVEYQPLPLATMRDLRQASWTLGSALLVIYVLGWLAYGMRPTRQSPERLHG